MVASLVFLDTLVILLDVTGNALAVIKAVVATTIRNALGELGALKAVGALLSLVLLDTLVILLDVTRDALTVIKAVIAATIRLALGKLGADETVTQGNRLQSTNVVCVVVFSIGEVGGIIL